MAGRIVFVTAGGPHPWIVANALIERFGPIEAIIEDGEPRSALVRRRIRKFGYFNAAGQTAMMIYSVLAKRLLKKHVARLIGENALQTAPRPDQSITSVASVNAPEFTDAIVRLKPDLIFLAGCRMMKASVLAAMPCPVINYHAGINPAYRGMNGGYWSLANRDPSNFGTTVHLVDAGVDTGGTLKQMRCKPSQGDTFMTYAYTQAAMSRGICVEAAEDVLSGNSKTAGSDLPSRQWYHPTIWGYVWTGITRGVW